MIEYLTPNCGAEFSYTNPDKTLVELFDSGKYLSCLHQAMAVTYLTVAPHKVTAMIADDGVLHELVHLASDINVCTHSSKDWVRDELVKLDAESVKLLARFA